MSSATLLRDATATRNDALEFAARTLKNLEAVDRAYRQGGDVHLVTQIANSLLGLIVFTVERHFVRFLLKQALPELSRKAWPSWQFHLGKSETLGDLVYHLRNASAHGRVVFSSDSRDPASVRVEFADAKPRSGPIYWRASIGANDLRRFCVMYAALLENVIG